MMTWGALGDNGDIIRDPTFPDIPTFKEVCDKTDGLETSGPRWEAWKAFFAAGFPMQKAAFLPAGTPNDVIATFNTAFKKVVDHEILQKSQQSDWVNIQCTQVQPLGKHFKMR